MYAPEEDRKLIYMSKACTPYVSVNCAFQIFTSVSWECLKGIKIEMTNTLWNSTGSISHFLLFLRWDWWIWWPPWCPVLDTFPAEFFRHQSGWLIKFLRDFFFSSKLNVFLYILALFFFFLIWVFITVHTHTHTHPHTHAHGNNGWNLLSPNSYVKVLIPSISECDYLEIGILKKATKLK